MTYTHSISVDLDFSEAVDQTRQALADQGFGVITEVDMRATFTAKLGPEAADGVGDYLILGACNPTLASRALAGDPHIGALLPCNVVIRRSDGDEQTTIETIDPATMVELSGSPLVREVADDADRRLKAALASMGGSAG